MQCDHLPCVLRRDDHGGRTLRAAGADDKRHVPERVLQEGRGRAQEGDGRSGGVRACSDWFGSSEHVS